MTWLLRLEFNVDNRCAELTDLAINDAHCWWLMMHSYLIICKVTWWNCKALLMLLITTQSSGSTCMGLVVIESLMWSLKKGNFWIAVIDGFCYIIEGSSSQLQSIKWVYMVHIQLWLYIQNIHVAYVLT